MTFNFSFPNLGIETQSTKESIVFLLSSRWPLSAKEIFSELQKYGHKELTYQAVHKAITQLESDGVVEKNGRLFELSREWISKTKQMLIRLDESYSGNRKKYAFDPSFNGVLHYTFDDYSVFSVEMARILTANGKLEKNNGYGIGLLRHAWWPFNFKFIDFKLLSEMMKSNPHAHVIVQSDTPLDRWLIQQYLKGGLCNAKVGEKDLNLAEDILFAGNLVIQIKFSPETQELLDEIYSRTYDLGDIFKEFVNQTLNKRKIDIRVTITKNPSLSSMMMKQLLNQYFKINPVQIETGPDQ